METTAGASVISVSIEELSLVELRTEYYGMKNTLTSVQSELDKKNQELYDCKRSLKTAEALEKDYQQEIEALQNNDNQENLKLKSTVQKLEAGLAESKHFYSEQILQLEAELTVKKDELKELQDEFKSISENACKETTGDVELLKDEIFSLNNEIEILKEKTEEVFTENETLKNRNFVLEEQVMELNAEVESLKESLQSKREELAEANEMINTLQEEMVVLRNEMETLQRKPLDTDSKGNSLFAEVDDKRVELQNTIKHMKTKYVEMKKEFSNLMKQVSALRAENVKLKECWEADLSAVESDEQCSLNSYRTRIAALETMVKSYQNELEENRKNSTECTCNFRFLENRLEKKGQEIESLRQELNSQSFTMSFMSDELRSLHTQLRKLRLEKVGLEQEIAKMKSDTQLIHTENVFTKLLNSECEEQLEKVTPIKRFSQNIDFSRQEKKGKNINVTGVAQNIFTGENKENLNNTATVKRDVEIKNENELISLDKIDEKSQDLSKKKVMFSEDNVMEKPIDKAPISKGIKVNKSRSLVITSNKK